MMEEDVYRGDSGPSHYQEHKPLLVTGRGSRKKLKYPLEKGEWSSAKRKTCHT